MKNKTVITLTTGTLTERQIKETEEVMNSPMLLEMIEDRIKGVFSNMSEIDATSKVDVEFKFLQEESE